MKDFLATLCAYALLALLVTPLVLIAAPVYLLFGTVLYGSWVVFGIALFLSWSIKCFLSLFKAGAVLAPVPVPPATAHLLQSE